MPTQSPDAEVWFLTGSQSLYGEDTLRQVAEQSQRIAETLAGQLPVRLVWRPVLTTSDAIRRACLDATSADECVGVVAWMHTFSPAKMWIHGLEALRKPLLHLHTQANMSLPWSEIDMDFMNLNQAALGWRAAQSLRMARFGDNMRNVAVTEGDKVEAERVFGFSVNTWGVNDLVAAVDAVPDADVDALAAEYDEAYEVVPALRPDGERRESLRYAARQEIGLRGF